MFEENKDEKFLSFLKRLSPSEKREYTGEFTDTDIRGNVTVIVGSFEVMGLIITQSDDYYNGWFERLDGVETRMTLAKHLTEIGKKLRIEIRTINWDKENGELVVIGDIKENSYPFYFDDWELKKVIKFKCV